MVNLFSLNTFDFAVRQHQSRHRIAKPITIGKGGNKLLASIKSPYLMPRRAIIIWNKLIEILKDATSIGVSWHNILIISLLLLMAWLAAGILFGSKSGILTWELSSVVLEIPNDAYTPLRWNLIDCSTLKSWVLQADCLILENNEKATMNVTWPKLVIGNT